MNEQTERSIRELAEKLGTTTEHLWGVLVKQAPITATCQLLGWLYILAGAIAAFLICRYCIRKFNGPSDKDEEWWTLAFLFGVLCLACAVISIAELFLGASMVAAGFFNPEYWALKQILP